VGDQLPADRAGQRRFQQWVGLAGAGAGQVQLHVVDLLEPGDGERDKAGEARPDCPEIVPLSEEVAVP